jgi:hypothetical protein
MPYPESCPECGGAFRNTGTHYTARRNEVGRHVLLELGCQNTQRRYWWDFTSGTSAEDSSTPGRRASLPANASEPANGSARQASNGHAGLATLEAPTALISNGNGHHADGAPPQSTSITDSPLQRSVIEPSMSTYAIDPVTRVEPEPASAPELASLVKAPPDAALTIPTLQPVPHILEASTAPPGVPAALKDAFIRQLQLDRLTLRQMRSWLMADDARRAIEVAAGATEATYERLALILFGADLPQLLGKQPAPPPNPGMSAEERLELQREKARIRARLRRAAAKAARQP